jgi:hypothetical protein
MWNDLELKNEETHSTNLSTDCRVFESINHYDFNPVGIEVYFHCKQTQLDLNFEEEKEPVHTIENKF